MEHFTLFHPLFIEILPKDVFLLQPFIFAGDVLFIYVGRGSTLGPALGLLGTMYSPNTK